MALKVTKIYPENWPNEFKKLNKRQYMLLLRFFDIPVSLNAIAFLKVEMDRIQYLIDTATYPDACIENALKCIQECYYPHEIHNKNVLLKMWARYLITNYCLNPINPQGSEDIRKYLNDPFTIESEIILTYLDAILFDIYFRNQNPQNFIDDFRTVFTELQFGIKEIKWFDETNEEMMIWTYDYLRKKGILEKSFEGCTNIDYFKSICLISIQAHAIKSLPGLPIFSSLEYIADQTIIDSIKTKMDLMKNKIKNAWTQKEYRKSNLHKKSHYYPLTKKAKQELAELAMLENVSESKILERLISESYLKNCVNALGENKY